MRYILALIIGGIFGLGIAISGMINPAKVINFFDISGTWDPSLIFVMGGALIIASIGYKLVLKPQSRPLFESNYSLPSKVKVDKRLVIGSSIFGIGWGMAGFCAGGAIPALLIGGNETLIFVCMMVLGIVLGRIINRFL